MELLPPELAIELTLLLVGTFVVWMLMSVVKEGVENPLIPRFIAACVVGVFAFVFPLALVLWFVSILFRYW